MIVCRNCGFVGTLADLKAAHSTALSCCARREVFEPDATWRPRRIWRVYQMSAADADAAQDAKDAARKQDAAEGFED